MPFSVTPMVGFNFDDVATVAEVNASINRINTKLGTQAWGDDGRLYVFCRAAAAIPAATAVCTVPPTTFLATASGGAYRSPPVAMALNDYGWFSKASV